MQPTNFILKSRIAAILRDAKDVPHVDRIVEMLNANMHEEINTNGYLMTVDHPLATLGDVTAALEEMIDAGEVVDSARLWEG